MDQFHKSLFLALYHAGLRSSEARALEWTDVDLTNGWIRVDSGKGMGEGKARIVPLSSCLSESLKQYMKESSGIFVWGNIRSFKTAWNASKRRAGIKTKLTPNALRHAFASHNLEYGTDLKSAQISWVMKTFRQPRFIFIRHSGNILNRLKKYSTNHVAKCGQ